MFKYVVCLVPKQIIPDIEKLNSKFGVKLHLNTFK